MRCFPHLPDLPIPAVRPTSPTLVIPIVIEAPEVWPFDETLDEPAPDVTFVELLPVAVVRARDVLQ